MPSENPDQQLHDKATRGEALTLEEQARLEAWYGQLDRTEGAQLAGKPSVGLLVQLQAQVEEATAELLKMVRPGVCGQARCLEPIRPNYRGTRL